MNKYHFLFLLLWASLILSCKGPVEPIVEEKTPTCLVGEWEWLLQYIGERERDSITPENTGISKSLFISEHLDYKYYEKDSLCSWGTFRILDGTEGYSVGAWHPSFGNSRDSVPHYIEVTASNRPRPVVWEIGYWSSENDTVMAFVEYAVAGGPGASYWKKKTAK